MKNFIFNSFPKLIFISLFSGACKVKAPDIIVTGSSSEDALLFLENYQEGKRDEQRLAHWTKHLLENHAPGFDWPAYWSGITNRKLYQSLNRRELNQLLSLVKINCSEKNLIPFAELLLQIARSDREKLLFSQEIRRLNQTCGAMLPQASFTDVVGFLSQKRRELEKAAIAKAKQQDYKPDAGPSAPYVYTDELQKVLVEEWIMRRKGRNWSRILKTVDRDFWSDARWRSYQNRNLKYLKNTLEMEPAALGSFAAHSLNQDVFLMFQAEKQMQSWIDEGGYEKHFAAPYAVGWADLWKKMSAQYPSNPKNGNAASLLNLYSFSSCLEDASALYIQLAENWGFLNHARRAGNCFHSKDKLMIASEETPQAFGNLKKSLAKNPENLRLAVQIYRKEKARAALSNHQDFKRRWKALLESYFTESDWLHLMRALRADAARSAITETLNMHHYLYDGKIPFLAADIHSILQRQEFSIADIGRYGYSPADIDHPAVLQAFWNETAKAAAQAPPDYSKALFSDAFQEDKSGSCSYSYIKTLFKFFSQFGKERVLTDQFRFENCALFLEKFKREEWRRLAALARRGDYQMDSLGFFISIDALRGGDYHPEKERIFEKIWWLVYILNLHSIDEASPAAAQISAPVWRRLIGGLLSSYISKYFAADNDLLLRTVQLVRSVHGAAPAASVCSFFAKQQLSSDKAFLQTQRWLPHKKSGRQTEGREMVHNSLVLHYDPEWLISLFQDLSWEPQPGGRAPQRKKQRCHHILSEKERNQLLYALSFSLFQKIYSEEEIHKDSLPRPSVISKIWTAAERIMTLSVRINRFESNDIWNLTFKSMLEFFSQDMDDYSFYINFTHQILSQLLFLSNGDKNAALKRLKNEVWRASPPATEYHKVYRSWMEELLTTDRFGYIIPGGFLYIPLPFESASFTSTSTAAAEKSPAAFVSEKTNYGQVFELASFAGGSAARLGVFNQEKTSHGQVFEPASFASASGEESLEAFKLAKIDYGQVFMEDIQDAPLRRYEISIIGGMDLFHPFVQSYGLGGEVKYKFNALTAVGLEGALYRSQPAASLQAVGRSIGRHGVKLGYSLPKRTIYLNSHYHLFKSHLNAAGFLKARVDFPLLMGLGLMEMQSRKTYFSMKFGAGPRVQLNRWLGLQALLSFSASHVEKFEFLIYPWALLGLTLSL